MTLTIVCSGLVAVARRHFRPYTTAPRLVIGSGNDIVGARSAARSRGHPLADQVAAQRLGIRQRDVGAVPGVHLDRGEVAAQQIRRQLLSRTSTAAPAASGAGAPASRNGSARRPPASRPAAIPGGPRRWPARARPGGTACRAPSPPRTSHRGTAGSRGVCAGPPGEGRPAAASPRGPARSTAPRPGSRAAQASRRRTPRPGPDAAPRRSSRAGDLAHRCQSARPRIGARVCRPVPKAVWDRGRSRPESGTTLAVPAAHRQECTGSAQPYHRPCIS